MSAICEGGRLLIYLGALVWMVWFTRTYMPRVRKAALLFYAGLVLEIAGILMRWACGLSCIPMLTVQPFGSGLMANLSTILVLGSMFLILVQVTRASQKHKREAEIDPLTGLYNRRVFFSRAQQALGDAYAGRCKPSIALLDVDNMKEINDVHGHMCGDEVLREAARAIGQSIRHDDVAARHGGDEFAVLFRSSGPHIETLKARIQQYLESIRVGDDGIAISLSLGVARYPLDGDTVDHLLRAADSRMYDDKSLKRRRVQQVIAQPQLNAQETNPF